MTAKSKGDTHTYVLGVGACTAVGTNAASSAAAVRAGISAFSEHPFMIDTAGNPMIVARASYLSEDAIGIDRLLQLAVPAAHEALASLSDLIGEIPAIPAIIGLPLQRPGLPGALDTQIVEKFNLMIEKTFRFSSIETIQTGHSSGLMALEAGWRKLNQGIEDFCLIGGLESYLEPETLEWLEECDQLHSAGEFNNAWGFVPGEAAGFCLLASQKAVQRHNLSASARVIAAATAREKNLIKTETVCLGEGLTTAFKQVLQALPMPDIKIDEIICDMNGEAYRAEEFGFATVRASKYFIDVSDFVAPADCWGDIGAASGPLFVALAMAAWRKSYAKGPYTLLWTSSESGERSVAILSSEVSSQSKRL